MKLLNIKATNFLPFLSSIEIPFSQYPYACISGANGAGKSSLMVDALVYALFGSTRLRSSPINTLTDKCEIVLDFEHHERIARIIRTSKQSGKNTIQFFLDEKDLTERKLGDTQNLITTFLGFSKNLLLATSVAEQDQINIFSNMSPAEREKILSHMIGLEIWEKKKNYTGKWLNDKKDIVHTIAKIQKQIDEQQASLANYHESQKLLHAKIVDYEAQLAPYIEKERTYFIRVGDLDKKSSLEQRKWEILQEIKNNDTLYQEIAEHTIQDLQEDLQRLYNGIAALHEKIGKEKELQLRLSKGREETLNLLQQARRLKENEVYIKVLDEVPCKDLMIHSTCKLLKSAHRKQEERDNFLEQFSTEIYENIEDLIYLFEKHKQEIDENYTTSSRKLQEQHLHLKNHELLIENKEQSIRLKKQEDQWKIQREALSGELKDIYHTLEELATINVTDLHSIQTVKADITQRIGRLREEKSNLQGHIENTEHYITTLQQSIQDIHTTNSHYLSYQTLHSAYSQIPSELFYQAIPEIEQQTNTILKNITDGHTIEFRIHKETSSGKERRSLDLLCHTQEGDREFFALSGSEKFRQSLALRIALAKVTSEIYGFPLHFFISDESFSSLDHINTQHMKSTIQHIAKSFEQFYIITHIEELKNVFPHEIHFTKEHHIQYIKHGDTEEVNLDS